MTEVLHHYVYKIEFSTGHTYFGSRSCKGLPIDDIEYLGSPQTHKAYWEDSIPVKVILREFNTREEANTYEAVLIEWAWSVNKSLSLNATIQGVKFNKVGISHTEETRKKISESNKGKHSDPRPEEIKRKISISCKGQAKSFEQVDKRCYNFTLFSPDGKEISGRNISQFTRENNLDGPSIIRVLNYKKLHYKGWTCSLEAHQLYLRSFDMRGVVYDSERKLWKSIWHENKKQKSKRFKTLQEAKNFRDKLVLSGYEFMVTVLNWKEKLYNDYKN